MYPSSTGASRDIRGGDRQMANHPNRSKKTAVFICTKRNGFGGCTETVRARNLEHATRIFAFRVTGTKNACIRHDGGDSFTLFGPVRAGGHNLGSFQCAQVR